MSTSKNSKTFFKNIIKHPYQFCSPTQGNLPMSFIKLIQSLSPMWTW